MAMYPSKKASGKVEPTETVLWTNPNPTSSFGLAVIDTPNLSSYDQIKVSVRYSTDSAYITDVIVNTSDFLGPYNYPGFSRYGKIDNVYATISRAFIRNGADSISFRECIYVAGSSANTLNTYLVPTQIVGINY